MKLVEKIFIILLVIGIIGLAGTAIVKSGRALAETDRFLEYIDAKIASREGR